MTGSSSSRFRSSDLPIARSADLSWYTGEGVKSSNLVRIRTQTSHERTVLYQGKISLPMRSWLLILVVCLGAFCVAQDRHSSVSKSVSKKDRHAAAQEFKRALDFQKAGQVDEALVAANRACELSPGNPKYLTARKTLRQHVGNVCLQRCNRLAQGCNLSP